MNCEELKKKIAQIIADYFCPQGNEHKKLWGDDRLCYSKMNFAECERIAECTDALIAAGIGDLKEHRIFAGKDGSIKQLYSGEEVEKIVKERKELKDELRSKVEYIQEQQKQGETNMIKTFIFVEDGSVDLDELKSSVGDDVLVISYRQGGTPPAIQQPREPVSRREVNIKDRLLDLMIEFDEMGFAPTTVCEDPEGYAKKWKDQVLEEVKALKAENNV